MGKRNEARGVLQRLMERSQQQYIPPCFPARIHFALGEYDQAFEWLDRAYEERDPFLCYLKADPFFDIVRSDPRYIAVLKKIGLDK
jgi:tetratricopeptide (TPR) repeat protein